MFPKHMLTIVSIVKNSSSSSDDRTSEEEEEECTTSRPLLLLLTHQLQARVTAYGVVGVALMKGMPQVDLCRERQVVLDRTLVVMH